MQRDSNGKSFAAFSCTTPISYYSPPYYCHDCASVHLGKYCRQTSHWKLRRKTMHIWPMRWLNCLVQNESQLFLWIILFSLFASNLPSLPSSICKWILALKAKFLHIRGGDGGRMWQRKYLLAYKQHSSPPSFFPCCKWLLQFFSGDGNKAMSIFWGLHLMLGIPSVLTWESTQLIL